MECVCGKEFVQKRKEQKYCSISCASRTTQLGRKHTAEQIEKQRLAITGKKHTIQQNEKQRLTMTGRKHDKHTEETKDKIRKAMTIDGRTPLTVAIRNSDEYRKWRTAIFIRDNRKCIECGSNDIHAHHVKPFKLIFEEFLHPFLL